MPQSSELIFASNSLQFFALPARKKVFRANSGRPLRRPTTHFRAGSDAQNIAQRPWASRVRRMSKASMRGYGGRRGDDGGSRARFAFVSKFCPLCRFAATSRQGSWTEEYRDISTRRNRTCGKTRQPSASHRYLETVAVSDLMTELH